MTADLKDLSPEDALAYMRFVAKLEEVDLEKLEARRLEKLTPVEVVLDRAKAGGRLDRAVKAAGKKRGPGRPKLHWKTRAKRYREYHRKYQLDRYHEVLKPRRKAEVIALLTDRDWYTYMLPGWKRRKVKVKITKEEWDRAVRPGIGELLPVVFRYDSREPISLYNILIKDSDTRQVLYDGKEQELRDKGYAL